jgi:hypothetical protein
LNEDHFRVLGALSRLGLKIELKHCRIAGAAAEALVEVLGQNHGPTKLAYCYIDYSVLADGLRGNSRLKSQLCLDRLATRMIPSTTSIPNLCFENL